MEQRLKERLTGAAILVALIVLIVPELFHGNLSERAVKAAGNTDGPPLRSYLIDLGGTHSPAMQLGTTSERGLAPAPAVSAPSVASESQTIAPSAAPSPSSPPPATNLQAAPVSAETPQSTAAVPAMRRASVPARAAPITAAIADTRGNSGAARAKGGADWSVQLGLYAKRANAEHMVHVAHTKGFSASLTKPDAKGRYRVRVAGLTTRSAALTLATRLRAVGLPAAAVGPR